MKDYHSNARSELKEKVTMLDILFLSLARCTLSILQAQNSNNNVGVGVPYFCLEFSTHKGVHTCTCVPCGSESFEHIMNVLNTKGSTFSVS